MTTINTALGFDSK